MIHKYFQEGQKLDVAGLNKIIVLIDRSETELTEVGLNEWTPNQDGPPHKHNDKDQVFYITSGVGIVKLGEESYNVKPGSLAYVPAGIVHQTITTSKEPLCYMLFNSFNNASKEGHTSFAEHIEKVKEIRKKQAESGNVNADETPVDFEIKPSKFFDDITKGKKFEFGSNSTILLLDRAETNRCELTLVSWPAGNKGAMVAHKEKEQTFFVLSGNGSITIGNETEHVKPGHVVFVPRNTPHTTEAGDEELTYLCFNALSGVSKDESFEVMYNRVAAERIKRWESGNAEVGE